MDLVLQTNRKCTSRVDVIGQTLSDCVIALQDGKMFKNFILDHVPVNNHDQRLEAL